MISDVTQLYYFDIFYYVMLVLIAFTHCILPFACVHFLLLFKYLSSLGSTVYMFFIFLSDNIWDGDHIIYFTIAFCHVCMEI